MINKRPDTDHTFLGFNVDAVYNPWHAEQGDKPAAHIMVEHPVRTKAGVRREYIEVNRADLIKIATDALKAVERLDKARADVARWKREAS